MNRIRVVEKIWGEELWIVNNNKYCGKILIVNKGYQSSLHKHLKKDETLFLLVGQVLVEAGKRKKFMKFSDSIRILPNTLHRFSALEDSVIVEFSTPHTEIDIYRVPGEYSRKMDIKIGKEKKK